LGHPGNHSHVSGRENSALAVGSTVEESVDAKTPTQD
jgi:hypothetical protein